MGVRTLQNFCISWSWISLFPNMDMIHQNGMLNCNYINTTILGEYNYISSMNIMHYCRHFIPGGTDATNGVRTLHFNILAWLNNVTRYFANITGIWERLSAHTFTTYQKYDGSLFSLRKCGGTDATEFLHSLILNFIISKHGYDPSKWHVEWQLC